MPDLGPDLLSSAQIDVLITLLPLQGVFSPPVIEKSCLMLWSNGFATSINDHCSVAEA